MFFSAASSINIKNRFSKPDLFGNCSEENGEWKMDYVFKEKLCLNYKTNKCNGHAAIFKLNQNLISSTCIKVYRFAMVSFFVHSCQILFSFLCLFWVKI